MAGSAGFKCDAGVRLGILVARENIYSVVTAKSSGTRVCGAAKQRGPLGRRLRARMCLYFSGVSTLSRVPLFGHGIAASNKGVLEHVTSFGSAPKLDSRNLIQRTVKVNTGLLPQSPTTSRYNRARNLLPRGPLFFAAP